MKLNYIQKLFKETVLILIKTKMSLLALASNGTENTDLISENGKSIWSKSMLPSIKNFSTARINSSVCKITETPTGLKFSHQIS